MGVTGEATYAAGGGLDVASAMFELKSKTIVCSDERRRKWWCSRGFHGGSRHILTSGYDATPKLPWPLVSP